MEDNMKADVSRFDKGNVRSELFITAAILVNVIMAYVANKLGMPVYLDTIGTIFISILGGFFPGIITAVATNLLCAGFNQDAIFFSSINVIIAAYAVWFSGRYSLKRKISLIGFVLFTGIISGCLGGLIQWQIIGGPQNQAVADVIETITVFPKLTTFLILNTILNIFDKGISLVKEVVDNAELIGNLGAAEDSNEGSLGLIESTAEELKFLSYEETAYCGQIVRYALSGCVCTMYGTESIGYVNVRHGSELLCKLGVIFGLFLVETKIFKEHNLAGLEILGKSLCIFADNVLSHLNSHTEMLSEALSYLSERELGVNFALGSAHVRAGNNSSTLLEKILNSGQGCNNALIIGDNAGFLVQGNVEIAAEQNFFAGYVDIFNGLLIVIHQTSSNNRIYAYF